MVNTSPTAYLMLNDSSSLEAVLCLSNSVILWRMGANSSLLNRTMSVIDINTNKKASDFRLADAVASYLYILSDFSIYLALKERMKYSKAVNNVKSSKKNAHPITILFIFVLLGSLILEKMI